MSVRLPAAGLAALAIALLVIAEFVAVFEVTVGSLEVVQRSVSGGANHAYALLVVVGGAALMLGPALRGARAPAAALVALGAAALLIALAIDLPDTRGSGRLPASLAYEDARARAGAGLYVELAGGLALLAAGLALLRAAAAGGHTGPPAPPARLPPRRGPPTNAALQL
ncbi:MAG: hypothetical protein ACR2LK_12720, partial [Solirubrobacteraceae bacterium]